MKNRLGNRTSLGVESNLRNFIKGPQEEGSIGGGEGRNSTKFLSVPRNFSKKGWGLREQKPKEEEPCTWKGGQQNGWG